MKGRFWCLDGVIVKIYLSSGRMFLAPGLTPKMCVELLPLQLMPEMVSFENEDSILIMCEVLELVEWKNEKVRG